jgi:hypothetical protein
MDSGLVALERKETLAVVFLNFVSRPRPSYIVRLLPIMLLPGSTEYGVYCWVFRGSHRGDSLIFASHLLVVRLAVVHSHLKSAWFRVQKVISMRLTLICE